MHAPLTVTALRRTKFTFQMDVKGTVPESPVHCNLCIDTGDMVLSFKASREAEAGNWAVILPALPMLKAKSYVAWIEVQVESFYFRPYVSSVVIVDALEPLITMTAPVTIDLDAPVDSEDEEAKRKKKKKKTAASAYPYVPYPVAVPVFAAPVPEKPEQEPDYVAGEMVGEFLGEQILPEPEVQVIPVPVSAPKQMGDLMRKVLTENPNKAGTTEYKRRIMETKLQKLLREAKQ